jgi:hypothetical protein
MISSQLTSSVAGQQRADLLAGAERSRRTAAVSPQGRAERPRRVLRVLRRRAAVA